MTGRATHGHTRGAAGSRRTTREWRTWIAMRARCNNPKAWNYPRYGGRGIKVCARWRSFERFLADMGPRPKGKTIDRIERAGDYKPGNCRWATRFEQAANRARPPRRRRCPAGHRYAGANVHVTKDGSQKCRACDRLRARRRRRLARGRAR